MCQWLANDFTIECVYQQVSRWTKDGYSLQCVRVIVSLTIFVGVKSEGVELGWVTLSGWDNVSKSTSYLRVGKRFWVIERMCIGKWLAWNEWEVRVSEWEFEWASEALCKYGNFIGLVRESQQKSECQRLRETQSVCVGVSESLGQWVNEGKRGCLQVSECLWVWRGSGLAC